MRSTLFHIPNQIAGMPVFGFGLLLGLWVLFSLFVLVRQVRREGWGRQTWGYVPVLVLVGAIIAFVFPRLADARGVPIRGYGVMVLAGVAAAVALAVHRARRAGIDAEIIFGLAFWAFVPGIIGARLFYVIEYWESFQRPTAVATLLEMINLTQGGLVVYGSLLGGVAGLTFYIRRQGLPLLATLDLITPSLLLGLALGRVGCFLNGCCYGGICDLPWAVRFPAGSPPHLHQVERGQTYLHGLKIARDRQGRPVIEQVQPGSAPARMGLRPGMVITSVDGRPVPSLAEAYRALLRAHVVGPEVSVTVQGGLDEYRWPLARSEPVHPTQLYAALNAAVLCLFLMAYDPFCRRDGQLWALFLTLYPIARFLLEALRDDEPKTPLSPAQVGSLMLLACAAALWIYILRRPPRRIFTGA
ncbi:MAG TPA: hypothetical protein EYP56_00155 [Planctomycetaceae bacterium]|nr:hypothetical protein [Planctomycetaceae bacterium]